MEQYIIVVRIVRVGVVVKIIVNLIQTINKVKISMLTISTIEC